MKWVMELLKLFEKIDDLGYFDAVISYLHCSSPKSVYGGTVEYVLRHKDNCLNIQDREIFKAMHRKRLHQTYSDFELILVNDGLSDNCPAICDEYAAADKRIKVIH